MRVDPQRLAVLCEGLGAAAHPDQRIAAPDVRIRIRRVGPRPSANAAAASPCLSRPMYGAARPMWDPALPGSAAAAALESIEPRGGCVERPD